MNILTVSDKVIHGLLQHHSPLLPCSPDIILACGDLPPEYLTDLRQHYEAPLYYIEGNHDIRHHRSPPTGCINIHARIVMEQGLQLLGLGGSRWYNGGINQYSEGDMKKILRSLWLKLLHSKKTDIVISHAPPRFIHDRDDPCHKGFKSFARFIKKQQPAFFIHGHIHNRFPTPADRITQLNHTQVINSYGFFFFNPEMATKTATAYRQEPATGDGEQF